MDSVTAHWTNHASTSINDATDEVVRIFEEASKSRSELQSEVEIERQARIASEEARITAEKQADELRQQLAALQAQLAAINK